jgi:hypothetical protein
VIAKPTTREQALSNAINAVEEAERLMQISSGRTRSIENKNDVTRWTQVADAWSRVACQLPEGPAEPDPLPNPDALIGKTMTVQMGLKIPAVPEDFDEDWEYFPIVQPMHIRPGEVVTLQTLDSLRLVLRYLMDQYLPAGGIRVPRAWLDGMVEPPNFVITAGEKGIDCKRA